MMPEIERNFDLGLDDKLIYRFLIIPIAKERVLEQAHDFAWIHTHGRPAWGPGRDGPFNLTKFNLLGLPDDDTVDNADFPSIWNAGLREDTSLNWAGETQDPLAVYIDSALGIGAPPATVTDDMLKHRDYLRAKQPPPYPFPIDAALAAQGEAVWARQLRRLPRARRRPLRPHRADRRDRHRPRALRHLDAGERRRHQRQGARARRRAQGDGQGRRLRQPAARRHLAARPLPAQRLGALADRAARCRPTSARRASGAAATSTTRSRSASAAPPPDDDCPRLFPFDTAERGNGNAGHPYGTALPAAEKAALIEYLKTL